jgi:hypothetical protein
MSNKWFQVRRFTGSPAEQLAKAKLAYQIYALHEAGHSWAVAERMARA